MMGFVFGLSLRGCWRLLVYAIVLGLALKARWERVLRNIAEHRADYRIEDNILLEGGAEAR